MEEQLILFQTAKLAKEKGFTNMFYEFGLVNMYKSEDDGLTSTLTEELQGNERRYDYLSPTQSLLQKFIRETRGVHIEIHRNASGYYWSMCKANSGTDLGWSEYSGFNLSGVWDSFEDALEDAMQVQLLYDLPNDTTIIKHWGNYVELAISNKKNYFKRLKIK
jgi:hypothetical protein